MSRILDYKGVDRLSEHKVADIYAVTCVHIKSFIKWLNEYLPKFEISTPIRLAAFLAQIGHESGRMRYVEEIASGRAYEGRKDLGNTQKGDGARYKGRGLIQITGRANYTQISNDLGIDFVSQPMLLSLPEYAVLSACWFWQKRGLNELADEGRFRDITRKINGGYNGLEDREKLFERAKRELNV